MPATIGYRDLVLAFRETGLSTKSVVLAIGPADFPEDLRGGASALLAALLASCAAVITPTFTFQTMVYPEVGPEENGIDYKEVSVASSEADFFKPTMPSSAGLGPFSEALRRTPGGIRSSHPILSFAGIRARKYLEMQTLEDPLAPVDGLARDGGDVILLGADHTANVAIFLAEKHAYRKQFLRWALTNYGVVECPSFPGCANGFNAIVPKLQGIAISVVLERGGRIPFVITRGPLRDLLHVASGWIREDPRALLCDRPGCPLCSAVRRSVAR